jgi:hypothetical protein
MLTYTLQESEIKTAIQKYLRGEGFEPQLTTLEFSIEPKGVDGSDTEIVCNVQVTKSTSGSSGSSWSGK